MRFDKIEQLIMNTDAGIEDKEKIIKKIDSFIVGYEHEKTSRNEGLNYTFLGFLFFLKGLLQPFLHFSKEQSNS